MSLQPKIGLSQVKSTGIIVYDTTGDYHATDNPGGFGAPNPEKAAIQGILFQCAALGEDLPDATKLSNQEQDDYLDGTGVQANADTLADSVYEMYVLMGFAEAATLTADGLSGKFTLNGASSIFANAVGFTLPDVDAEKLYRIDRTRALTNGGGYVTETLPSVSNETIIVYFEGKRQILIYDQGDSCLKQDIAAADLGCGCTGAEVDKLLKRYAQYLSMLEKFEQEDYTGAHKLALKLHADCENTCVPCGSLATEIVTEPVCIPPAITLQPSNVTINSGADASFTVRASGTATLAYQWYKNGIAIAGATSATLNILNATNADEADYKCIVSNGCGTVESDTVTLDISGAVIPVTIITHPVSVTAAAGTEVVFTVAASGSPTLTYQWRKDGVDIVGETGSTLTLSNIDSGDEADYDVVVTNPAGSVTSNPATLTLGVLAKCGWADAWPAAPGDIDVLQSDIAFTSGGNIVADFRANAVPKYLIMAEPSTEPAKSTWYANPLNNGVITDSGSPYDGAWYELGIIGSYRVYVTTYLTYNTEDTIEFRI